MSEKFAELKIEAAILVAESCRQGLPPGLPGPAELYSELTKNKTCTSCFAQGLQPPAALFLLFKQIINTVI